MSSTEAPRRTIRVRPRAPGEALSAAEVAEAPPVVVTLPPEPNLRGESAAATGQAAPSPTTARRPIGPFPRRPWRWRLSVVILLAGFVSALRIGRELIWGEGRPPTVWYESILSYGSTLWALPAIPASLTIVGMLLWRGPLRGLPAGVASVDTSVPFPEVSYRIVSRGTNRKALADTVAGVRAVMAAHRLFRYRIEVVTDVEVDLPAGDDLHLIVVPDDYETPGKSRYKARALHYAVCNSPLDPDAWIMHLDEESVPSDQLVVGIHDFITQADDDPDRNIGQGVICYDRMVERKPFLTLADMIRTGDDVGRYHLQHRLGFTIFGLHGSFILVRNDVASRVGFDFGPDGSITEDAFWALRQMATGQRCRWVEGELLEQSTQSFGDFVRQRRRWFDGMIKVVLFADVQAWIRVPLAIFTLLWSTAWASMLFTILNLFLGLRTSSTTAILGDFAYGAYLTTYVIGLRLNLRHHPELRLWQKAWRYVVQVVAMPVFATMEAAGVLMAIVKPEKGFHVVDKDIADEDVADREKAPTSL